MQLAGGSVCAYIMPKHIFKDIPEAEWEKVIMSIGEQNSLV